MLFGKAMVNTVFADKKIKPEITVHTVKAIFPRVKNIIIFIYKCIIRKNLAVFKKCVYVKNKKSSRIQIVMYKLKKRVKIAVTGQIIYAVKHAQKTVHSTVKLKFTYVLIKIEYSAVFVFFGGNIKHHIR